MKITCSQCAELKHDTRNLIMNLILSIQNGSDLLVFLLTRMWVCIMENECLFHISFWAIWLGNISVVVNADGRFSLFHSYQRMKRSEKHKFIMMEEKYFEERRSFLCMLLIASYSVLMNSEKFLICIYYRC